MKNISPTDRVSADVPARQQQLDELIPFDAAAGDLATGPTGDTSHDPDDLPPTPCGADLGPVIRAPREPVSVRLGYSVYAVEEESDPETGEPEVVAGQCVAGGVRRIASAEKRAFAEALHPDRFEGLRATAVIVNDGTGKTLARFPVLRVA